MQPRLHTGLSSSPILAVASKAVCEVAMRVSILERGKCCARLTPCAWPTACLCVLQSLSAQLRSRELSLADAEAQLAAKDEALAAAGQETANMHKVRSAKCVCSVPLSLSADAMGMCVAAGHPMYACMLGPANA